MDEVFDLLALENEVKLAIREDVVNISLFRKLRSLLYRTK